MGRGRCGSVFEPRNNAFQWGDVHVVTYLPPDAQVFTVAARKAPEVPFTQTASLRIDGQLAGQHHFTDGQWHVLRYDLEARPLFRTIRHSLIGIALEPPGSYYLKPDRFFDNLMTRYAGLVDWLEVVGDPATIQKEIAAAALRSRALIDNSRQMKARNW